MKKLLLVLLVGVLLAPLEVFADKYNSTRVVPASHPPRTPALYQIGVYVDSETGVLTISPNYDIAGLNITIVGSGVTYVDTTVSLSAGAVYTDSLAGYADGEYILTLTDGDGNVIDQYLITVAGD